jgi:hypothetical protein
MDQSELFLTDNPDAEARRLIDDRLGEYAGTWDPRPL